MVECRCLECGISEQGVEACQLDRLGQLTCDSRICARSTLAIRRRSRRERRPWPSRPAPG